MVSEERRKYQAKWQRDFLASKHGGVSWPKGRPRKVPLLKELKCIFCTQHLMDEYHITYPCWKSKLSRIFDTQEPEDIHFG